MTDDKSINNNNNITKPISFDDNNKISGQQFRGLTEFAQINQLNQINIPQTINKSSSSSFGYIHQIKYPKQIITLELDDTDCSNVNQQKQQKHFNLVERYYNELQSELVINSSCSAVINKLSCILSNYSIDIDFTIDYNENIINGVIFMCNFYSVFFSFDVWNDTKNNANTRFEFIRRSGDALASSKFYSEIKSIFFNNSNSNSNDTGLSFISLDLGNNLDINDLFDSLNDDEKMEMDLDFDDDDDDSINDVYESLKENDILSVDELGFLYNDLCNNYDNMSSQLIKHDDIMYYLINSSLQHQSVSIVRTTILILNKLAENSNIGELLINKYKLINNISNVFNNKYSLIRKYCIRLLSVLSLINNDWNLIDDVLNNVNKSVKMYESEWLSNNVIKNGCINQNMFNNIYKKLKVD